MTTDCIPYPRGHQAGSKVISHPVEPDALERECGPPAQVELEGGYAQPTLEVDVPDDEGTQTQSTTPSPTITDHQWWPSAYLMRSTSPSCLCFTHARKEGRLGVGVEST